jgi:hypothetical protein
MILPDVVRAVNWCNAMYMVFAAYCYIYIIITYLRVGGVLS